VRQEFPMQRTDDVWHVALAGLPKSGVLYTVKVDGDGGWETGHRWDFTRVGCPFVPRPSQSN
jgi:hypothetical protein